MAAIRRAMPFWYDDDMNYLFVCNGNVARSQEAEAFFNDLNKGSTDRSESAGINVKLGKPIDPLVVEVMNELGFDVSNSKRKFINEEIVDRADVIISFKPLDELPDFLRVRKDIIFWQVADPQHQSIEFHREVRDAIRRLVSNLV